MARYCAVCGDWDCCKPDCPDHKVRCGCGDYANSCACRHSPEDLAEIVARESGVALYLKSYPIQYMPPGQPLAIVRWNEADADPLADIKRWRDEVQAASCGPNNLWMPVWTWRMMYRIAYRKTHTKRAWRRHRGDLKQRGLW